MKILEHDNVVEGFSSKKLLAIVTVALMFCSLLLVAPMTDQSVADVDVESEHAWKIMYENGKWVSYNTPQGVTVDEAKGVVKIEDLDFTCNENDTMIGGGVGAALYVASTDYAAIHSLTIEISGNVSLRHSPKNLLTQSAAIGAYNVDLKIKGTTDKSSLCLYSHDHDISCGVLFLSGSIAFENISVTVQPGSGVQSTLGIFAQNITFKDSQVKVLQPVNERSVGNALGIGGKLTATGSIFDVQSANAISLSVGIVPYGGSFSDCPKIVSKGSTNDDVVVSIGLAIDAGADLSIRNSPLVAEGKSSGVAVRNTTDDYSPMRTSCFSGLGLFGTCDGVVEPIKGKYIDLKYTTLTGIINTFDVIYDLNGGSGDVPGQSKATAGSTVTVTDVIPIKHGYFFAGWADAEGNVYEPGDTFTMGYGNVTLTAQWKEIVIPAGDGYDLNPALLALLVLAILAVAGIALRRKY